MPNILFYSYQTLHRSNKIPNSSNYRYGGTK
jgi:hypothetical protein